jgi:hypothetical protein
MAIRRCPYCKAIIDEGSEYCSNCGTQLLFPEDEHIHEEIPGEKIIEEEISEEENPKKRKSSSRRRKKEEDQQEIETSEEEEETEPVEEEEVEGEVEFEPKEERAEEERDEYFVEKQEPAFNTEDLEKVIDPEEKEKAEIEKFLKSLKEDRDEWNGEIPPTDELPPWAEKIKDEQPDKMPAFNAGGEGESQTNDEPLEEFSVEEEQNEEVLPLEEAPVAEEEVKLEEVEVLEPVGVTPEDEVPEVEIPEEDVVEEEITSEEVTEEDAFEEIVPVEEATLPDTSMGLPEGVEQESLPFDEKASAELEEKEKSPPSRLSIWLKSRAFDVLFIAALWIVTLHIASRMLSTNLFRLISDSVLPVIAFYLALLAVYLFLFFLFLGQTLGDHLFPHEE